MGADKKVIDEWIEKADEDFGFASVNLDDQQTVYFSLICFHYHQAVEKYLKAYIVANNLEFEKIHNLKILNQICLKNDAQFKKILDDCLFLNVFYIESRYPLDTPTNWSRVEAEKARVATKRIKDFVKKLL